VPFLHLPRPLLGLWAVRVSGARMNSNRSPEELVMRAHGLKIRTIAEGVETEAQLALLQQLGCDEIQGYWYARALDAAMFERFSRR
jgi:EAL domain-containing protein (putative c-di-GMP-specific phosphodiesterase class I)